jgi:RNA recognition motif-containing protein
VVAIAVEPAMLLVSRITRSFQGMEISVELGSLMISNPVPGTAWESAVNWTIINHMSNKLFVGNLSFDVTENDLNDAFAAYGAVTETNLMMDRTAGRSRGFGFVTMSTAEEAQKAIAALNGKELKGRALTVNVARPREERPGGGGGRREHSGGGYRGGNRSRY